MSLQEFVNYNINISSSSNLVLTNCTIPNIVNTNISTNSIISTGLCNLFFNSNTLGNIFTTGGNVGINTISPNFTLDVSGTARFTSSITTGSIFSTNITSTNIFGTNITTTNLISNLITVNSLLATTNISTSNVFSTNITSTNLVSSFTSLGNLTSLTGTFANKVGGSQTVGTILVTTSASLIGNTNTIGNIFTTGGNVGVNTVSPITTLDINGNTRINFSSTLGNILSCTGFNVGNSGTQDASRQNMINMFRNGTGGVQNGVSAELDLGSNAATINGISTLDFKLSSFPGTINNFGRLPDNVVMSLVGNGNVGINNTSPTFTLDVNGSSRITGTITSGNTPYKIWLVTGTFPASTGTVTNVSLPSGCSPANVTSVTGVTNNTNGDWVPFNYSPSDPNYNVIYYIQNANTSLSLVNSGTSTQSRPFRVTIMTFA